MSEVKFTLFENDYKKTSKHPDFKLSFKDQSGEWQSVGAAWYATGNDLGKTHLSISLDIENLQKYLNARETRNPAAQTAHKEDATLNF